MNHIKPEQFLELPEEVQKVFIDWWEPEMYDLFLSNLGELGKYKGCIEDNHTLAHITKNKGIDKYQRIPLFRLEQLWKFIEDKTEEYIGVDPMPDGYLVKAIDSDVILAWGEDYNILEIFWKAAVKVVNGNWREK